MEELTTRTLPAGDLTPARVYAALRAKAPQRTSYLIEASAPDESGERRSVIGFLVKSEAAYGAGADGLREIAGTAVKLAAKAARADLPAAGPEDVVALLTGDVVLPALGVAPRPELPFAGRELGDASAVVFDHVAGTITIASMNANTVERIARVIADAPSLAELPTSSGARAEHVTEHPIEPEFTKQLRKAERKIEAGKLQRLAIGRTFVAPTRGADMFEVYRALKVAAPMRFHFFVELPATPMFGAFAVAAAGDASLRIAAQAGEDAIVNELLAFLSPEVRCGAPVKEALAAWRDVTTFPFGMLGSAVVRARSGGHVEAIRADAAISLDNGQMETLGVADVIVGRDPAEHSEAAAKNAAAALAAIRHVHDAMAARESN
ncbi:MAG: hypothetical protein U0441_33020 [Polyangiaceae bacterium]